MYVHVARDLPVEVLIVREADFRSKITLIFFIIIELERFDALLSSLSIVINVFHGSVCFGAGKHST